MRPLRFVPWSRISTIGRLILPLASQLAPGAVERWAARAFARPLPLLPPRAPEVPGLVGRRFDLDGAGERLAVWEWGGAGPTVLLVHGWNGQAAQMSGFVAPLVASGYYVVAFDQPAHGLSSGSSANLLDLAQAVAAVGHKVGPVHAVIAHSLGATAAALAIARGLSVDRAVLVAPPAEPRHFMRAFAARLGLSPARTDGMIARLRRQLGDLDRLDLPKLAPGLATRALILHDPTDREVPFAHGQAIAAAWRSARLEAVRGLGHRRLLSDRRVIERAVELVGRDERIAQPKRRSA